MAHSKTEGTPTETAQNFARFRRVHDLWNWLPTFRAVAEHGSVIGAAKNLHITAPAVSASLKKLEQHLDVQLFDRGKGMALTESGARLLEAVRFAMRSVHDGLASIEDGVESKRVACEPRFLPALLEALGAGETPGDAIGQLVVEPHFELPMLRKMVQGKMDAALCVVPSSFGWTEFPSLKPHLLLRSEHRLVMPSKWAARAKTLSPSQAKAHAIAHATARGFVDGWPVDVDRRIAFEAETLSDLFLLLEQQSCAAFVPATLFEVALRSGPLRSRRGPASQLKNSTARTRSAHPARAGILKSIGMVERHGPAEASSDLVWVTRVDLKPSAHADNTLRKLMRVLRLATRASKSV